MRQVSKYVGRSVYAEPASHRPCDKSSHEGASWRRSLIRSKPPKRPKRKTQSQASIQFFSFQSFLCHTFSSFVSQICCTQSCRHLTPLFVFSLRYSPLSISLCCELASHYSLYPLFYFFSSTSPPPGLKNLGKITGSCLILGLLYFKNCLSFCCVGRENH